MTNRTMRIGGISALIAADDAEVLDFVDARYARFLANGTPAFSLTVKTGTTPGLIDFLSPAAGLADRILADFGRKEEREEYERPQVPADKRLLRFQSRPNTEMSGGLVFSWRKDFAGVIDPGAGTGRLVVHEHFRKMGLDSFLRICFSVLAFTNDGLLVHSAGAIRNGRGYLFFGPSETGKSTLSRLSLKHANVLSDEMILLQKTDGTYRIHGTPFFGEESIGRAEPAGERLRASFIPVKDTEVRIAVPKLGEALGKLLSATLFFVKAPDAHDALLARATDFLSVVPCYALHFRKDDSFWKAVDDLPEP